MVQEHPTQEPASNETQVESQSSKIEEQLAQLTDLLRRERADFENYRKRTESETSATRARLTQSVIKQLLPVYDGLELALKHKANAEATIAGIEGVHLLLKSTLEQNAVELIDPTGQVFDPTIAQAVATQVDPTAPNNTVLSCTLCAVKLGGLVLRSAKVIVNKKN